MIRIILVFILVVLLYQAVKTVVRSAIEAARPDEPDGRQRPRRHAGEEMVQDPQCRTYIVKDRAVTRRVHGEVRYFCSIACADAYARRELS
ncbi:MAG: hypothetical protein M0042_12440 [Nitrospiraceae bacterium]|nr:hypothetical protein [Nitrospiraceae bacterium]